MSDVVLLAGFRPFGGRSRNPSGEIAEALDGSRLAVGRVLGLSLPVERGPVFDEVREVIEDTKPWLVVALGLAADRTTVDVETTARNLDDFETPDEAGQCPKNEPVIPGGAETLTTTLDGAALVEAIRAAGVPAGLSHDAGRFLCNHLYYRLLDHARRESAPFDAVFLHLPLPPEMVAAERSQAPSLPIDLSRKAVMAVIGAVGG